MLYSDLFLLYEKSDKNVIMFVQSIFPDIETIYKKLICVLNITNKSIYY